MDRRALVLLGALTVATGLMTWRGWIDQLAEPLFTGLIVGFVLAYYERNRSRDEQLRLELSSRDDLRRIDLEKRNLTGFYLAGKDLRGAKLDGASLRKADLSGARLANASLKGADLSGANLSGAILAQATEDGKIEVANLEGAKARWALFPGAGVQLVNFTGADLRYADFKGGKGRQARFTRTKLNCTKWDDSDFKDAVFVEADLRDSGENCWTRLYSGHFHRADFSGADLRGVALGQCGLMGSKMIRADLREASVWATDFRGIDLSGADLSTVKDATIRPEDERNASFKGAIADQFTIWPPAFNPTERGVLTQERPPGRY